MKKEEILSAGIMTVVSVLVLIGFTVAWYTGVFDLATAGSMRLKAAEMDSIKIALVQGGDDISVLDEDERYADIGLQTMTNIESGKLAPGQSGKVTFYLTPSNAGIEYCEIVPAVWIRQGEGAWYPGETENMNQTENLLSLEELYEMTQRHIDFFADAEMETPIDEVAPLRVEWSSEDEDSEKKVVIYWKWYYEYPFSDKEGAIWDEDERQRLIDVYDSEDTRLGNDITAMRFHFSFSAK